MPDLIQAVDPKEAAGNWRRFENFCWDDQPEDADYWTVILTRSRDADLVELSNSEAIEQTMREFVDSGDVRFERFTHWAFGWVDGLSVRVFKPDGTTTGAWAALSDLAARLQDYPLLDEEDYYRREYEATLENIGEQVSAVVRRLDEDVTLPDDVNRRVFDCLWDNDQRSLESVDDRGGYPGEDAVRVALGRLGVIK